MSNLYILAATLTGNTYIIYVYIYNIIHIYNIIYINIIYIIYIHKYIYIYIYIYIYNNNSMEPNIINFLVPTYLCMLTLLIYITHIYIHIPTWNESN